ncbi:hypothetical protein J6590_042685 [Homalodisca vitripennis]|nr:hypothetical protein J6590_042685 [Homalodisca vitripennis]
MGRGWGCLRGGGCLRSKRQCDQSITNINWSIAERALSLKRLLLDTLRSLSLVHTYDLSGETRSALAVSCDAIAAAPVSCCSSRSRDRGNSPT